MKKSCYPLLVMLIALLSSCVSPKLSQVEMVNFLDYSKYTNQGFFITESNSVSFEYAPMATVTVTVLWGDEAQWVVENGVAKKRYGDASPERALELAVKRSREKGANAIINLHIESVELNGRPGILLTGMAVDRQ